ncbi:hypothetical protein SAMN05192558_101410 [Actinokineospora alba]|uniref:Uncharacterized protein n=1 Tax=Actinokineospora alba TaxID=504798 RepID=A0A1H0FL07_9PSEU|nr:hypothetical protein [Actinokineospora alba]TDP69517.1 hypothetical protein C8E96_5106 [Actinokineospora alba]SDI15049.1 hypothetical protein SAMN05421871_103460 [Actinokineospora alba]SDN95159.1 hypothetical protein SAMN05192558_101410 [Actinokineospora alba]
MTTTSTARGSARTWWPELVSWALGAILTTATLYGLLSEHAYRLDRQVEIESIAQDVLTLAMVPALVWAGRRSRTGSLPGHLLWLGLLAYIAYTYVIYAIGVPHNQAFLLYIAAVTLSVAAFVDGIGRIDMGAVAHAFGSSSHRGTGWFLIVIGVAFTGLWLTDIVPTIDGGLPTTIGTGGLPYPVYVADLGFALPAVVMTGIALVRGHIAAPVLGAIVLIKITTLGLAIWAMAIGTLMNDSDPNWTVAGLFAGMIVVCTTVLAHGMSRIARPSSGWLRPTLWQS